MSKPKVSSDIDRALNTVAAMLALSDNRLDEAAQSVRDLDDIVLEDMELSDAALSVLSAVVGETEDAVETAASALVDAMHRLESWRNRLTVTKD